MTWKGPHSHRVSPRRFPAVKFLKTASVLRTLFSKNFTQVPMILLNQPCRVIPQGSFCLFRPGWIFRKVIFTGHHFIAWSQSICTLHLEHWSTRARRYRVCLLVIYNIHVAHTWASGSVPGMESDTGAKAETKVGRHLVFWSMFVGRGQRLSKQNSMRWSSRPVKKPTRMM